MILTILTYIFKELTTTTVKSYLSNNFRTLYYKSLFFFTFKIVKNYYVFNF